jgi:hypothetical protein
MTRALRTTALCALFFSFSMAGLAQTTYYVSPLGADANNGSIGAPFLTLAKAVSVTANNSNTIIYLRGGTHNYTARVTIANTKNGTAATRIRVFAYPGDPRPVLNFSSMATSSSNQGILMRASYWHFKGFDVYGAGDNGFKLEGGGYNILENCAFYECDDSGVQIDDGAHHNQVINCDSYFNKDPDDGNADGFACKLLAGTGNSFKGCRAWQNSDDGWDGLLSTGHGNITTTYDSCWCFLNGYLKTGVASKGNGNGFKIGGNETIHDATLTRCLAVANRVKGFDQNNNVGDMILYNCTGYRNGPNYGFNNFDPAPGKKMEFRNCVSFSGKSNDAFRAVAIRTNNSWQAPFVTNANDFISLDTSVLRGPRKADGSLPDINLLHLVAGSDLIDGGLNVGLPFNGTAPDLGAFETSATLPVKLAGFTAVHNTKGVLLEWTLVSEINNKGWTIERSDNGSNNWKDVGFVQGAGNSNAATKYHFLDAGPQPGAYFYRLRQVDMDGKISYSHVLLVTIGKRGAGIDLAAFPNPFRTVNTIRFNVPVFAKVNLSLYNEAGQQVQAISNQMMEAGSYQQLFNGSNLAAGKYILKLQVGAEWVTTYIVKM